MPKKQDENVVNFNATKDLKEFVEFAGERIGDLECFLYTILECETLEDAKQVAADALEEDLETYLEEDELDELDFDDDAMVPWDDVNQTSNDDE